MTKSALAYAQTQERRRNLEIEKRDRQRAELVAVSTGVDETVRLEESRGAEFVHPPQNRGEGLKPKRRVIAVDGLDSLKEKHTAEQHAAGRRFERFYKATHRSDTKSCLDFMEGGLGLRYTHTEAVTFARDKLKKAQGLVGGHTVMWVALVAVCGEGGRTAELTDSRRSRERMETQLDCALTILVKLWGM